MNATQTKRIKFMSVYRSFKQLGTEMCLHKFSDPELLDFVNYLLSIPRYNKHFVSFPANSLNGGVR